MAEFAQAPGLVWAAIAAEAIGDNTVVAAIPGKVIRVHAIWFNTPLAVLTSFKSGSTVKIGAISLGANEVFEINFLPYAWIIVGQAFVLNNTLAVNMRGAVLYTVI